MSPSEQLTRYIMDKSYYRANGTVRHNAFMPAGNGQTSVFCISNLADSEIWDMGIRHVSEVRAKPLLGRADITAKHVFSTGLQVRADPEPHPRHANIVGWPGDKSKQKLVAIKLAEEAFLRLI